MKKFFFIFLAIILKLQALDYEAKGTHYMAQFYDCPPDKLSNRETLRRAMLAGANACGAQVLKECYHNFEPGDGFTQLILLSESHASIHTYPEHGVCFVDLFTCGDHCDYAKFEKVLSDYFKSARIQSEIYQRY